MSSLTSSTSPRWHIALWILQVLLALAFLASGGMKLTTPIDELVKMGMTWAADMPWLPRFIGASEVAGGLGLVLPAATRIAPVLTPIAAAALCFVMVLGVGVHAFSSDIAHAPPAFILGVLCAVVAYGRLVRAPIRPK